MKQLKNMNRKAVLSATSILFVTIVIVLSTIFQAGIDPDNWGSKAFISSMIITIAIAVFGIVSGTGEGDNHYRNKEDGLFRKTYNEFNIKRKDIDPHLDKFSQWVDLLYDKEYHDKVVRYLRINGIKQIDEILKLDRSEIENLRHPYEKDGVYFKSLNEEQIKCVYNVFDGKITLRYNHESYYLNAYAKSGSKSMYELASEQEKRKRKKFLGLTAYRIMFTILIGLIFAGLTTDALNGSKQQAIINLFSRLFTLFTAITWGFFIASELIKDESVFIDYKTETLSRFLIDLNNGNFVYKSVSQEAIEEYKKFNKQKEMEMVKNE